MNAAARLVTNIRKFDRGLRYMRRHVLHWLDVTDRIIKFRLCITVYKCVQYTEWHLVICQSFADQFLYFKDGVTCVLLVAAILTFLMSDVPLTEDGRLPTLALLGTHFLTI